MGLPSLKSQTPTATSSASVSRSMMRVICPRPPCDSRRLTAIPFHTTIPIHMKLPLAFRMLLGFGLAQLAAGLQFLSPRMRFLRLSLLFLFTAALLTLTSCEALRDAGFPGFEK